MCGSVVRLGVMSYLGGGSDPLVCEGPSAHGVERGAPPTAPGVLKGALGGQSTQATTEALTRWNTSHYDIWRLDGSRVNQTDERSNRSSLGRNLGHDLLVVSFLEQWLGRLNARYWGP